MLDNRNKGEENDVRWHSQAHLTKRLLCMCYDLAANVVIVFDPNWNVTLDLQAQDRAYRIGQKKYTKIFRFISAGKRLYLCIH
jgi:hypothetical protein